MATTTIPRQPAAAALTRPSRLRSLVRGHADEPAWARPLLIALLALTAISYLIDLTASGYANSFYAAAVQAGTKSWKAFFFGSIDSSNFITVDKPPASLWVMELSGRLFGFSSGSMLVPQVLEGVVSVALLAAAVKRWFGAGAGLLAGTALAVTPVAALMFRFNNPDALMVCLMVAAAYCLVRALENGRTRWLLGVGALLGFAFLAKMMEAFLVVPGFALVYLIAAPVAVRQRLKGLLFGGVALLVSSGWWVAIVALWPASSRPMIDGSPDNSILNLIFGYNGFGRLSGGTGGWELQRRDRGLQVVQRPDGRPGLLAAAGGADRSDRRACLASARSSYRPATSRAAPVGQLAARQRRRLQLQQRRDPHLLHGRARACDCCPGGDRRDRPVAAALASRVTSSGWV